MPTPITRLTNMEQEIGSPAHKTLIHNLDGVKKTLIGMLQEGSRDWEVMADLLAEVASFQNAADRITGQR